MGSFLLQASGCMILFYGVYFVSLRKLTFFEFNRWFLLGSILLSLIIPLIAPYFYVDKPILLTYDLGAVTIGNGKLPAEEGLSMMDIGLMFVKWVYAIGVALALTRFGIGLYKIMDLYRSGKKVTVNGLQFVYSQKVHLPFSFMKAIFLSENVALNDELNQIIMHEKVHISRLHTFDVVLTELVHAIFWFNPILIFYKRALKASHEFIADAVVTTSSDKQTYLKTLLNQSVSGLQIELTNQFFHSQIKKRLEMMNMKSSNKKSLMRYMMIIPLVLVLGIIFASAKMHEAGKTDVVKTQMHIDSLPSAAVYYINDVPSTKEVVEQLNPENILSVDVIKPTSEMNGYVGEKHDGVVFVYTNKLGEIPENAEFYINEKKVEKSTVDQLDPASIKLINRVGKREGINNEQVNIYTKDAKYIPKMPSPPPPPVAPKAPSADWGLPIAPTPPAAPSARGVLNVPTPPAPPTPPASSVMVAPPPPPPPPAPKHGEVEVMGYFKSTSNTDEIFKLVDEMPIMKGCETESSEDAKSNCSRDKIMKLLFTSVKYPKEARESGIEGTAVVSFVVNKSGDIVDPTVLRDPGGQLGEAALDAIKAMGKNTIFNPGKQNGKSVNVAYTLPVKFKLKGDDKVEETIKIRASSTMNGQPLFIVDGKEVKSESIKEISPDDIESIDVLKDKSAEPYGEKGKNGVVVIKTKSKTNILDEMVVVGFGTKKEIEIKANQTIPTSKSTDQNDVVGHGEKNDIAINAYPNPAHDKVTIDINPVGKEDITVEAYNIYGKLVKKEVIKASQKTMSYILDVSGINDANMLIIAVKQGKHTATQKVVLSK